MSISEGGLVKEPSTYGGKPDPLTLKGEDEPKMAGLQNTGEAGPLYGPYTWRTDTLGA